MQGTLICLECKHTRGACRDTLRCWCVFSVETCSHLTPRQRLFFLPGQKVYFGNQALRHAPDLDFHVRSLVVLTLGACHCKQVGGVLFTFKITGMLNTHARTLAPTHPPTHTAACWKQLVMQLKNVCINTDVWPKFNFALSKSCPYVTRHPQTQQYRGSVTASVTLSVPAKLPAMHPNRELCTETKPAHHLSWVHSSRRQHHPAHRPPLSFAGGRPL